MNGMQFDVEGEGDIEKALEKARKQFPYSAEKALRKESLQIKKQIVNSYVGSTIKSKRKNWKKSWKKKKNTALEKKFWTRKSHKTGRKIYHCCSIKSASLSPRRRWA